MPIELQSFGSTCVIDSSPGMSCAICRSTGRAFLFRKGETDVGICEPCSGLAGWAWRQLAGEVSPGFNEEAANRISRAYVLIARRKMILKMDASPDLPEAERRIPAPAEVDSSYEFLLLEQPDGSLDLPSAVVTNQSPVASSMRALADMELISWEPLLEPLYTAYSPRGRLVTVVLARGWGELPGHAGGVARHWSPWPLSSHTGPMAGFWRSLESVWRLRLYKHCSVGEPGELCVLLRKAAREFIELQEAVRLEPSTDTTFMYALQACMSADEIVIARMIQSAAKRAADEKALVVRQPRFSGGRKPHSRAKAKVEKSDWPELAIAPKGMEETDLGEPGVEGDDPADDEADAGDVSEEESTFVRPPRSPQK